MIPVIAKHHWDKFSFSFKGQKNTFWGVQEPTYLEQFPKQFFFGLLP